MTALDRNLSAASHAVFVAAARAAQVEARRDSPERTYVGAGHAALTEVDTAVRVLLEARAELLDGLHRETVPAVSPAATSCGCISATRTADEEPR